MSIYKCIKPYHCDIDIPDSHNINFFYSAFPSTIVVVFFMEQLGTGHDINFHISFKIMANHHIEMFRFLVNKKKIIFREYGANHDLLQHACLNGYGYTEFVEILLEQMNPIADNNLVLILASAHGHTNVVKLLLANYKDDPSANDNEAIMMSTIKGHIEIATLLLNHKKIDSNAQDCYKIAWAVSMSQPYGKLSAKNIHVANYAFNALLLMGKYDEFQGLLSAVK